MKKFFSIALLITVVATVGCANIQGIQNDVSNLRLFHKDETGIVICKAEAKEINLAQAMLLAVEKKSDQLSEFDREFFSQLPAYHQSIDPEAKDYGIEMSALEVKTFQVWLGKDETAMKEREEALLCDLRKSGVDVSSLTLEDKIMYYSLHTVMSSAAGAVAAMSCR